MQFVFINTDRYRFIKDNFFLLSLIIYGINFLFIRYGVNNNYFMKCYFNDLFLIPVALPVVLYLMKILNLRGDHYPTFSEILICLII